ncbi:hypothetical protein E2C01_034719 [Portunus trituberculatus]|uniref:Uncharacterized protein n=1 Tax=Portunus trituberculatus TaxID=210409 RepID=A0A5B7F9H3_PORTR|nr:hypothetical protein [Portunus trituberculatus]
MTSKTISLDIAGPLDMNMEGRTPRLGVNIHLQTPTKMNVYPVSREGQQKQLEEQQHQHQQQRQDQLFASSCQAAYFYAILKMSLVRCGSVSARTGMYFRRLMVRCVGVDDVR